MMSRLWEDRLRSLPPKSYESMPRLDAPAGYICVIRAIDSDTYRIDSTDHPATFVSAIMVKSKHRLGIELISILEADDLSASESELYERHHARLSEDWHELDAYQLQELRRSILQIDAHRSVYLARPRRQEPSGVMPQDELRYGTLMTSMQAEWRDRGQPHPPSSGSNSVESLALRRRRANREKAPFDLGQYLWDRFHTLLVNHPFKVMFVLSSLLIVLLLLGLIHGYHASRNVTWP